MNLREELFLHQDPAYQAFQRKLIPTAAPDKIIGVRLPVLRKLAAKAMAENADNQLEYYEEVMVYGFTIGRKKGTAAMHREDLASFIPLIDNWAVCDSCCASFKFTAQYREELYPFIKSYLSGSEYEARFAVVMLMDYYLTDGYIDEVLSLLCEIKSDYYYVNMAVAWALSVAFVKYRDKTLPYLTQKTLTPAVQNKTIQKIKESYRVTDTDKQLLNSFKISR